MSEPREPHGAEEHEPLAPVEPAPSAGSDDLAEHAATREPGSAVGGAPTSDAGIPAPAPDSTSAAAAGASSETGQPAPPAEQPSAAPAGAPFGQPVGQPIAYQPVSPAPTYAGAPTAYPAPPAGYPGAGPAPYSGGPVPPAFGAPNQPYGTPGGPQTPGARPKTLAVVALVLAAVGLVLAFIPIVTWFSGIFLLAGFVIALIALISKKQGGKGFAIGALTISIVGWIVSIVVTIASFAIFAQDTVDTLSTSEGSEISSSDSAEEADETAGEAQEMVVVESAFGRDTFSTDTWWYVVILENPNTDYIFDFESIDVEALDAAGTILDTAPNFVTLLSGQTAITGSFLSVGQAEIASLNVRGPSASAAISAPADETGSFTIEGLTSVTDEYSTTVRGTVSGTFEEELEFATIVVVARAPAGNIIGGAQSYVDRLPTDGTKVQFEVMFFDPLPADTAFEAYANI